MPLPTLIVMLKEPRAGLVKTRLGRDIGMTNSAWWFRHQSGALLRRLYAPRRWNMILAVAPDSAGLASRAWPAHLQRIAQGQGDLGVRMARLLREFDRNPVCLIGGDIPGISQHHVFKAFKTLGAHDAVFGPAKDGGFWLVGITPNTALPSTVFQGVRWSTKYALTDALATLPRKRIGFVDTLRDIDTIEDLAKLQRMNRR
ncbi:MAG: DUF2064 domain-containing protein [Pseudomonadota bacterium]